MALQETLTETVRDMRPIAAARHFAEISAIPRPSKQEAGVRRYISEWARSHRFETTEDAAGNISIHIPATEGFESSPHIILQGHMDMVTDSTDPSHDFTRDAITLERTGEYLHSAGKRTTLGADNGMGVSMALALAEDSELQHGTITILCTADEETGMTGASGFDSRLIPADAEKYVLINIDSEDGAHVAANGSAGGARTFATLPITEQHEAMHDGNELHTIKLTGLKGGHSGIDVHRGHGNAIVYMYKLLRQIHATIPQAQLIRFSGGAKVNSLPYQAECTIAIPSTSATSLQDMVVGALEYIKGLLAEHGESVALSCTKIEDAEETAITAETRKRIFTALHPAMERDGVLSATNPEYPELSTTTGVMRIDKDDAHVGMLSRATVTHRERLSMLVAELRASLQSAGFVLDEESSRVYEGWQEPETSEAVVTAQQVHKQLFGTDLTVRTYHAGVEVQTIKEKIEAATGKPVSCIAIGPRIEHAHTTGEQLHVPSVAETYSLLRAIVEKIGRRH